MHLRKLLITLPISVVFLLSSLLTGYSLEKKPTINLLGKDITFSKDIQIVNNRILVPCLDFMNAIGGTVTVFDETKGITIKKNDKTVTFNFNKSYIYEQSTQKTIDTYPQIIDGTAMVPIRALSDSLDLGVSWDPKNSKVQIFNKTATQIPVISKSSRGTANEISSVRKSAYTVVVDPGHGGSESGAVANGVYEKDLNLEISKIVANLLEEKGFKVFMTRTDDKFVGLYERTDFANSLKADLFLSIHNNAGYLKDHGTMTLYHPNYDNSIPINTMKFASNVQNEMIKTLGSTNQGLIERPNLAVLRTSQMPSILVEVGYMTNKNEFEKLMTSSYKNKAANAIVNGIIKAFN